MAQIGTDEENLRFAGENREFDPWSSVKSVVKKVFNHGWHR
jgi:hypothetical protein